MITPSQSDPSTPTRSQRRAMERATRRAARARRRSIFELARLIYAEEAATYSPPPVRPVDVDIPAPAR